MVKVIALLLGLGTSLVGCGGLPDEFYKYDPRTKFLNLNIPEEKITRYKAQIEPGFNVFKTVIYNSRLNTLVVECKANYQGTVLIGDYHKDGSCTLVVPMLNGVITIVSDFVMLDFDGISLSFDMERY